MAIGDMFSRLTTALGQLTGKTQQGEMGGGAAGADLMPEVLTMQGHWRDFLREKLASQGDATTAQHGQADAASMTDLDALLDAPGGAPPVSPAGPGGDDGVTPWPGTDDGMTPGGGGGLDDLDALLEMPGGDGQAPADDGMAPGAGDDLSDLDALLETPGDDGEAPGTDESDGEEPEFDWLNDGDGSSGGGDMAELDALFG